MRADSAPLSELRFLTCGSVDDGKSTLIGRLLADSVGLLKDQEAAVREESKRFGTIEGEIDYALLLDGLEAEREQGITIDVAYRFFSTNRRAFVVADTPGHQQYTRNMATGASNAELAVLLVDARKGVLEQTRRHAAIVDLMGIRHVVLAVNKMDLVGFSQARFAKIEAAFAAFARPLAFGSVLAVPLSARHGDNVASRSHRMPWYEGPALLAHLETVDVSEERDALPMRFPVQWINRLRDGKRGLAGTVASGRVAVGDSVVVAGTGRLSTVAHILSFDGELEQATAGRSITLQLADEVDVARGDVLAPPRTRPIVGRHLSADVVWLDDQEAKPAGRFLVRLGTALRPATLLRVENRLDLASLERQDAEGLSLNGIGRVEIELAQGAAFDPFIANRHTGAFILIDRLTLRTAAVGMIRESASRSTNVYPQAEDVTPEVRAAQKGQQPLVVWLTGLPGSGKSTIANLAERRLVALGRQTMLLDGDNLRQNLNADLGFDANARSENVRRVAEVAKLMTDAGLVVLVALVSPFRADRLRAASLVPAGRFLEVFVDAPPSVCRARDTKGIYARAERGEVPNFTGRDQAYEPPEEPALALRTAEMTAEEAANRLVEAVLNRV